MAIKKHWMFYRLVISLTTSVAFAENPVGQSIQINTHFQSVAGKPSWLLIVRDVESGQVSPYIFDIRNNDNFWIAFTYGRSYRVSVSNLKWGPYAIINNFCNLEDGILDGRSLVITLSGDLTPISSTSLCHVLNYKNSYFPIVSPE